MHMKKKLRQKIQISFLIISRPYKALLSLFCRRAIIARIVIFLQNYVQMLKIMCFVSLTDY